MIEFEGEFELDMPPEELWPYFTDPDVIADCAPGMKELKLNSPSDLEAVMSVKVGSVSPTFDVDVTVVEATKPSTLRMSAVGNSSRNAFETAAHMDLQPTDEGGTLATWNASAEVSGLIASLGQRALGGVTTRLVNNFFDDLQAAAESGEPAESKLEGAEDAEPVVEVDADE
ncbi:CoxG family protein [Haloarchaeobius litoreus]|uniref:CoxG family protein n=1 Tax=Haloarchaeobius litoreus TaxID=755306 RepID=A0ABD6DF42_9EURY|nr:carbon monoxide dehydrogenase subunit G [Haloarchaeobius litoreus]